MGLVLKNREQKGLSFEDLEIGDIFVIESIVDDRVPGINTTDVYLKVNPKFFSDGTVFVVNLTTSSVLSILNIDEVINYIGAVRTVRLEDLQEK